MTRLGFAIAVTAALAVPGCGAPPTGKGPAREVLPFIENDYARARSEATARKLPIFVDVWAPW